MATRGASSAGPSAAAQRSAAARLLRTQTAPTAPAPAIRKGGSEPSRARSGPIRGGADVSTVTNIMARYTAEGWNTIIVPTAALMDFIAVRGDRMHFVKVFAADAPEPSVGWRNQYIQNAMSNSAEPVFANGAEGILTNINESRRVVIARRAPAASMAAQAAAGD